MSSVDAQPNECQKIEGRDAELKRLYEGNRKSSRPNESPGDALAQTARESAPKLPKRFVRICRSWIPAIRIRSKLSALDEPRRERFRSVELLFSPNPANRLKPLRAGSLERRNFRGSCSRSNPRSLLMTRFLFSCRQIDTNVGGEIARAVGAKMHTLGREHSADLYHHLAPVAAAASSHFVVTKERCSRPYFSEFAEVAGKARREESRACSEAKASPRSNSLPVCERKVALYV